MFVSVKVDVDWDVFLIQDILWKKKIYAAINIGKPIEIFPLCQVDSIEESQNAYYKYKINFTDRRENKDGIKVTIKAKLVVLAAGTLGSTEILLRSKNLQLSNTLGTRFSTNGDLFGVINPTKESIDATRGPQITSIVTYRDNNTRTAGHWNSKNVCRDICNYI
jgi:hypothetical protein